MLAGIHNLSIETASTEEEAAERLESALGISTQEMEVEGDRGIEVEEGGGGTQQALETLEFLSQGAEPSGTTRVDACNSFNELSRLALLWTVRHRWPAGARFAFKCYKHWAQLLLRQPSPPQANTTPDDADAAGVGGRHGAGKKDTEKVTG